jgi:hypothetical protein
MNYGDFVDDTSGARAAPFMQLLSITNPATAHQDFINNRLTSNPPGGGGVNSLESMGVTDKIKHFFVS